MTPEPTASSPLAPPPAPLADLALVGGQRLVLEAAGPGGEAQELTLRAADGTIALRLSLGPAGPVLRLAGRGLRLEIDGDLEIAARQLTLHGRDGLSLRSGGEVRVDANDDLRLNGERVLVNC